ncbi:MAG: tetratricopeptide repeat protein [Dissulfurispiraceae bacterium]
MRIYSSLRLNIISTVLSLAALISLLAGNVFAQEAWMKTAGTTDKIASLGAPFSQLKIDSAGNAERTPEDDTLAAKTHHDRGVDYLERGQYDLALAEFNKALDIYPTSAEIYNNRGVTYAHKGQYDLAIIDFTKAIEIMPDSAKTYYNRGIIYATRGQAQLALFDFKKCLELDPTNAAAYDNRGSVFADLACSDWANACQLGNCDRLREAVKIGLCVASTGNNPLSP